MKFYNNRQLVIFLTLLEANRPITSEQLSKISKISIRTVKEEIRTLKELSREHDITIVSKPGLGYYLQYEDEASFREFAESMFLKYRSASVVPTDFKERVNYIIRRFLSADGYLKVENFAEGLYVNPRALAKEMKAVRAMLNDYKIGIETKPGYGMRIAADEYHLRVCMVDYFEFYFHRLHPVFRAEGFLEAFDFDYEERLKIRRILMNKLTENQLLVPDYCSQKLVIHLLVMRSRTRRGCFVEFCAEDLAQLQKTQAYKEAQQILEELKAGCEGFSLLTDQETAYFALHLMCGRDVADHADDEETDDYYRQAAGLRGTILSYLQSRYGFHTKESLFFEQDLLYILHIICVKQHFDIKEIQGTPTRTNHIGRNILQSPVCVMITLEIVAILEERLGGKISEYDMLNLTYLIFNFLDSVELKINPINLILIAENSKIAVRSLVTRLRSILGKYINKIYVAEVYELRGMKLEEYAGGLTVHNIANFAFPLELIKINYFLKREECDEIFVSMILKKQDWLQAFPEFTDADIYRNFRVESMEAFLQIITFRHFRNQKTGEDYKENYLNYSAQFNLHSYNNVLVLCNLSPESGRKRMELFEFAKNLMWNDNLIKYAVYLEAAVKTEQEMKLLEIFARRLEAEPVYMQELLRENGEECYMDIIKKCMLGR